ncbi:hypothetical protein GYMLUDRAFT_598541 [Collybiopsis luxurians FD-317 M1]|uniref:Uncharacterized protein n=1 Tax=Collybiopsis luxurians FD-317 M1 TaxID=944289 RepID=A0A0D0CEJ1_9AGAR|nr:hypothetical protein GYMLUDRAFT_598541 [Collybiopsis luxurians FD-317 M1]
MARSCTIAPDVHEPGWFNSQKLIFSLPWISWCILLQFVRFWKYQTLFLSAFPFEDTTLRSEFLLVVCALLEIISFSLWPSDTPPSLNSAF